jgi:hypothetical protein
MCRRVLHRTRTVAEEHIYHNAACHCSLCRHPAERRGSWLRTALTRFFGTSQST